MLTHLLKTRSFFITAVAASMLLSSLGIAQTPPPAKGEMVQLLFVQNSRGVAISQDGRTLTLKDVSPTTLYFSDRPVRIAGHYTTRDQYMKLWTDGGDQSFRKDPPNATLSVFEGRQSNLVDLVVKLQNPRFKGNDLLYDITVISGTPPRVGGPASLFIDLFGRWAVAAVAVSATHARDEAAAAAAAHPTTVTVIQAPPPPPPAAAAPAVTSSQAATVQKLKELKSLLSQGLITQSQYNADSQKLVNELVQ
jgi:hypothetical protein